MKGEKVILLCFYPAISEHKLHWKWLPCANSSKDSIPKNISLCRGHNISFFHVILYDTVSINSLNGLHTYFNMPVLQLIIIFNHKFVRLMVRVVVQSSLSLILSVGKKTDYSWKQFHIGKTASQWIMIFHYISYSLPDFYLNINFVNFIIKNSYIK